MKIPTSKDISPTGGSNLDEKVALDHFNGKGTGDAEVLFRENLNFYLEDLQWMGINAFEFYYRAADTVIRSKQFQPQIDVFTVYQLINLINERLGENYESASRTKLLVSETVSYLLDIYPQIDDSSKLSGKVEKRLKLLQDAING